MKYLYLLLIIHSTVSCVSSPKATSYNNNKLGFINSKEYFNKTIPFTVIFPQKVYIRNLNILHGANLNKDGNLFRVYKNSSMSSARLNPQFDCYSNPISHFNKDDMSIDQFITSVDDKQKSFGNKIPNYSALTTLVSDSGLEIKTRSSEINYIKYKIIAKQFFTKIKDNLIFCAATYKNDSREDIQYFNNVIKSFSNNIVKN